MIYSATKSTWCLFGVPYVLLPVWCIAIVFVSVVLWIATFVVPFVSIVYVSSVIVWISVILFVVCICTLPIWSWTIKTSRATVGTTTTWIRRVLTCLRWSFFGLLDELFVSKLPSIFLVRWMLLPSMVAVEWLIPCLLRSGTHLWDWDLFPWKQAVLLRGLEQHLDLLVCSL